MRREHTCSHQTRPDHESGIWGVTSMNTFAEADEPDRAIVEMFMRSLDLDERVASALVEAGLTTIDEVAYIPLQELLEIAAITQTLLLSLRERARQRIADDTLGRAV